MDRFFVEECEHIILVLMMKNDKKWYINIWFSISFEHFCFFTLLDLDEA